MARRDACAAAPGHGLLAYVWTAAVVGVATATGALGRVHLALPDFVMLYLLGIGLAAAVFGRGPSLLASCLSVLCYNFFFVPPFYTLAVADVRHLLTFAMMFAVGLVTSALTLRLRRQASEAQAREERTATLYALSRDLGSALDQEQAALVVAQHAAELCGGAVVLLPDPQGALRAAARCGLDTPMTAPETNAARWAFEHGRLTGSGTETVPEAGLLCVPLRSGLGLEGLGVLAVTPSEPTALPAEERPFLEAFARQAALALERARLAEAAKSAAIRARTEEMRSSLLSAVSHDLRTPLAAITGAATTLRASPERVEARQRAELLDTICEEAERLERLVRNLLDMTQLESGALRLRRDWVPMEEMVGSALTRLEARLAGRAVAADLPADLPMVRVDPVLLEQVFVNLLDNAAKYTPPGTALDIHAWAEPKALLVEVGDRGPGLPADLTPRLFEKFVRGPHASAPGAGLGLAICRGIVEAHGGRISAGNREGGGALFRISLPLEGLPPSVPSEPETGGAEAEP